jgi:hypothetical protein
LKKSELNRLEKLVPQLRGLLESKTIKPIVAWLYLVAELRYGECGACEAINYMTVGDQKGPFTIHLAKEELRLLKGASHG